LPLELAAAARVLLLEVSRDPGGLILRLTAWGGSACWKTNGRLFGDGSPAEQTRWQEGMQQLLRRGLVEAQGDRGQVFCITPEGYEAAYGLWGRT